MLEVKNLAFSYDNEGLIKDIRFIAKPGEITAIIGANGAGKTTLLKCISGLEKCSGYVSFFGKDCASMDLKERMSYISYLDQNTDCFVNLTVYEVVLLGRIDRLSFRVTKEDTEIVDSILERMSLTQFAGRKIFELSGGQRQLVFIAQTLVKNPKILIMDEPTSALDLNKQFILMDILKKVTVENNYVSLLTLHHLDIAYKYADRVVIVNDGVVYAEGKPLDVMTEKMLNDVYKVDAELTTDRNGQNHIFALSSLGE